MGLATKLADVMGAVGRVAKHGRNEFHKYDYATEADIVAVVRVELAKQKVILLPAILNHTRIPVGEKGSVLTILEMEFTFIDGESGEQEKRFWLGAGSDKDDKGVYKAMTGGEKYFLLKTFLIPTGDDPERDTTDTHEDETPKMAPLGQRPAAQPEPVKTNGANEAKTPSNFMKMTSGKRAAAAVQNRPMPIPEPPPLTDDDIPF